MHDIKFIRSDPDAFDKAMQDRGAEAVAAKICDIDEQIRNTQASLQDLQQQRNQIAKQIGIAKSKGEDAAQYFKEAEKVKTEIPELEDKVRELTGELEEYLVSLPNIADSEVPIGQAEEDAVFIRDWGAPRKFDFKVKEHSELGAALGLMDFKQTSHISGSRFVTLKGGLARLERALANFMLDIHINEYGYTEVAPPALVRDNAMFGVGQLPKFDEDSFKTTNGYRLIPTAEVSLTNMVAEQILDLQELPYRFTAFTPCFRSEAGSAGKDTHGMIRLHQFSKVELVSITRPEDSQAEHERMTAMAEDVLKRLQIPYRVMLLSSGDVGFSAQKTYDLEVWIPSQNKYREISSCSNCGDFQARRMKARYKDENKKNRFVHTLNGSALAVGRTIVAIMENYQNTDGSISIPEVLHSYMGSIDRISK